LILLNAGQVALQLQSAEWLGKILSGSGETLPRHMIGPIALRRKLLYLVRVVELIWHVKIFSRVAIYDLIWV
jgi:hypothetical protein